MFFISMSCEASLKYDVSALSIKSLGLDNKIVMNWEGKRPLYHLQYGRGQNNPPFIWQNQIKRHL
jgi:hypothetical protein